jgi:UDP-N-acetylglucosamine--N-acetylmuramyl-(pentapeptide) pyrophosphoryl-undecaprenol N-acetylglucosamine transferase
VASLRVLIAGGGTGGHVIPALAIAGELRDAHDAEVRFVGTARGLETRLVPEANFPLELMKVGQLKGVSLLTRMRTLADLPLGILRCAALLRSFKPDVVIGVGGYASGPAMMAAILLRIPTLAFEPNAAPGLANRIVGKRVSAAAVNFEETRSFFRNARVTGIPVRREFFDIPEKPAGPTLLLLVFGGSQGARVLNEIMPKIANRLLDEVAGLEIVHQAGGRHGESTREAYQKVLLTWDRVRVQPYLDDMVGEFAAADLMLCRSGASTVAELAAAGKAAVLIPFPQAADDHQRKNADAFVAADAALLIVEADLTEDRLVASLVGLLSDNAKRETMGHNARRLAYPKAVEEIAQMAVDLAKR